MEVMAWLTHWKFDRHLVESCAKYAAFLRFIIIHLLLVQPVPYPQLHLAELLDDRIRRVVMKSSLENHTRFSARWGCVEASVVSRLVVTTWTTARTSFIREWRGEDLRTGPAWLLTQVGLCLRARGPRRNKLCHLSHTNPPAPPRPPFVSAVIYSETARMSSHGLLHSNIAPQRSTHLLCNTANLHPYEFKFIKNWWVLHTIFL